MRYVLEIVDHPEWESKWHVPQGWLGVLEIIRISKGRRWYLGRPFGTRLNCLRGYPPMNWWAILGMSLRDKHMPGPILTQFPDPVASQAPVREWGLKSNV